MFLFLSSAVGRRDGNSSGAGMPGGKDGHIHCSVRDTALSALASQKSWIKALKEFEIKENTNTLPWQVL